MMRRLRTLDACVFLLSVVALLLVGLLRSAFATFPLKGFLCKHPNTVHDTRGGVVALVFRWVLFGSRRGACVVCTQRRHFCPFWCSRANSARKLRALPLDR